MLTENILALCGAVLIFTGLMLIIIYRKDLFKKKELKEEEIKIPYPPKKNDANNKKL